MTFSAPIHTLAAVQWVLLLGLTTVTYWGVNEHTFVWDTIPFVLENPWIHEWSWENTRSMLTEAHRANWHPLVLLSHAVDISLFGYNSGAHHLMNVAYHGANGSLLFLLIFKLLPDSQSETRRLWTAWLTAAIFAIHPQHVESVAWVVERKDVLYALFTLLSLNLYVAGAASWQKALGFVMFLLALASKPMAVTLPVVLILIDVYKGQITDRQSGLRQLTTKVHYFIASGVVALVTLSTQSMAMPDAANLPLWAKVLNATSSPWFYIEHYIWPIHLSPFYPYPQNSDTITAVSYWLPSLLFVLLMSTVAYLAWQRDHKWPLLILTFYLITLLPVSGLVQVGPARAADRFTYLATIPISLITALCIAYCWQKWTNRHAITATITTAYLGFLMATAQVQVGYWQNSLNLWLRVTDLYPASHYAHRNMAAAYLQTGDLSRAQYHAELSLQLGSPDVAFVESLRELDRERRDGEDGR